MGTDYIQSYINESRSPYELTMLQDIQGRVSPGDFVLDVGANVGNHTLYLACIAECRVAAFEPNKRLASAIESSRELNKLGKKIEIFTLGVGASPSRAEFDNLDETNLGAQNLQLSADKDAPIQVVTLDEQDWSHPVRVIKIDVEGMEFAVLCGAAQLIQKDQPVLYVECQTEQDFVQINQWLTDRGYHYWDTFNATPTHLFLPADQLNSIQLGSHSLYQAAREKYHTVVEHKALRKSLHEAAEKYRRANQQIADLKSAVQLAQQESKSSAALLAATRDDLVTAQQLLQSAREQEDQSSQSLADAKVQHDELAEELHASNTKYQHVVNQQIPLLKSDLQQAQLKQQTSTNALAATENNLAFVQQQLERNQIRELELEQSLKEASAQKEGLLRKAERTDSKYQEALGVQIPALELRLKNALLANEEGLVESRRRESALEESLEHANQQEHSLQQQLKNSNDKYRAMASVELPAVQSRLAESVDRRRIVEKDLADLRDSITFRTGQLINQQSGSLTGLLKLPVLLWRLKKLSNERARQRNSQAQTAKMDTRQKEGKKEGKKEEKQKEQEKGQAATKALVSSAPKPSLRVGFLAPERLPPTEISSELDLPLLPKKDGAGRTQVACILDDFTFSCFQPECQLQQLTPDHWQQELENQPPELLFIESAWRGKDELWGSKVGHQSKEVKGIVAWCKKKKIPTAFWNKEDPVHFETFVNTAKLFDYIFTTDIDCVHRYKAALGHDHVYLLPFACQPALHNPIEIYQRRDCFSFAGAYYARYPHRTKDLEGLVEHLPAFKPLEIYDRNYGQDNTNYQFPENYQPYIVGSLPFNEIDKAYKGYRYAINLNSVKQSQSMFARRIFELLGSNTITISNFSRGIRLLLGDLVLASDNGEQVVKRLQALDLEQGSEDKLRLRGLRKVMHEHTYEDRFNYVLSKVNKTPIPQTLPGFAIFTLVNSAQELTSVIVQVQRQKDVTTTFHPVVSGRLNTKQAQELLGKAGVTGVALSKKSLSDKTLAELSESSTWCTGFMPGDYYGQHYLLDIALASRYSQANLIGKAALYDYQDDRITLVAGESSYRSIPTLPMRSAAISPEVAQKTQASTWITQLSEGQYRDSAQISIDRFNYCRNGAKEALNNENSQVKKRVDDVELDSGVAIDQLLSIAEEIKPVAQPKLEVKRYSAEFIGDLIGLTGSANVAMALTDEGFSVHSELADDKHQYFYAPTELPLSELLQGLARKDQIPLFFDIEAGLNISLVTIFFDAEKARISHQILRANANHTVELPPTAVFVRLGLRVYSSGQTVIKEILFGHKDLQPAHLLARSPTLLLTNHYPYYDDLYRNGFVHSRVKAYQEKNVAVDIFRLRKNEPVSWHEFQNIDVTTGSTKALRQLILNGKFPHVLVHFLNEDMWEVLREFVDRIKITVWLHGAEVQPWWRREYNYDSEESLAVAKIESAKRLDFWRKLLNPMPKNLRLVFVSQYLAEAVMEDVGIQLDKNQYEVIHNPIDTDLFKYQKKDPSQRMKILSIRPFASRTYANDLSVQAILLLSKERWFKNLEIRLIGDGLLFDETLEPIKHFDNVTLERRFLTQNEITQYHKNFGIFLCPTRMDSQGVSRDEAMASGLVPVTNAVAAIPEFTDSSCAILAPADDAHAMADGIRRLYEDPELFLQMSASAEKRVRAQTEKSIITQKELSLFSR